MKIIKLKEGDKVPKGARFISAASEKVFIGYYEKVYPTRGIMGMLPIIGTDTVETGKRYKTITVFFYEVDEGTMVTEGGIEPPSL